MKRAINIVVWTTVGLYLTLIILLHIPVTQSFLGTLVSDALSEGLGSKVSVGRVDLGFINRLIIDDVYLYDQKDKQMLRIARLSAKINPIALFEERLSFSSIQLFGVHANLYQEAPNTKPNYQFVLDSLSADNNNKESSPLDLQVNSIVIRHGAIYYRRLYKNPIRGRFSFDDIAVSDLSSHIILNRLTKDSLNVMVKSLSFVEKSGLCLKSLKMDVVKGRKAAYIRNFRLVMPHSVIESDDVSATYQMKQDSLLMNTLQYAGRMVSSSRISPSDFSSFLPILKNVNEKVSVNLIFTGTASSVQVKQLHLQSGDDTFTLYANGNLEKIGRRLRWRSHVERLRVDVRKVSELSQSMGKSLPEKLVLLGNVLCKGYAEGYGNNWRVQGFANTDIGDIKYNAQRLSNKYSFVTNTENFKLGVLLSNNRFGQLAADISVKGYDTKNGFLEGNIKRMEYNGHLYQDIRLKGNRVGDNITGNFYLGDPNGCVSLSGNVNVSKNSPSITMQGSIQKLSPKGLCLSKKWGDSTFDFAICANLRGNDINKASGSVRVSDFVMQCPEKGSYVIDSLMLQTGFDKGQHFFSLNSDFGWVNVNGYFDYTTLSNSVIRMISNKLPTMPGLPKVSARGKNDFDIAMHINDSRWVQYLLGIPLEVKSPLMVRGSMDDSHHQVDITCQLPEFLYNGAPYKNVSLHVSTPNDTLVATGEFSKIMANGCETNLSVRAGACDNRLSASIEFKNNERHPLAGILNASAQFRHDTYGRSTAFVEFAESSVSVGDSTWNISPSTISYRKDYVSVHDFCIRHGNQYVSVDGIASTSTNDSLLVNLNGIDVRYVLDLINFHSVDFDGSASGRGCVSALFSKHPQASAQLTVDDFLFESGRMGTLSADISYDDATQQIDIEANAKDGDNRNTLIDGYVSPGRGTIDLKIQANRTRLEFMESFCGSFMRDVDASADGSVRLFGKLSNINLTGQLVVDGSLCISSLNTTYTLRNDTVSFIPNEIVFSKDTIYDRNGNVGVVEGSIHHKHLTNLSYDLGVKAKNLLSYDTHTFGENTFYGTAYVTGDCFISGRSGEVNIDINATPCPGCIIVYNVNDIGSLSSHEFLHWVHPHQETDSMSISSSSGRKTTNGEEMDDENIVSTNIRLNFLVNCTPDATIKLIMDEQTGDYITLNGDGILRATYYNKGSFDIYGNYIVDHGVYKLTVQNVIKRDFAFQKGGTIAFGGNPYNADINLKAMYVLNSVSLSDLNIGKSFTSNNVRVNCLMNITGSPNDPNVDFDIDLPSLGNDAKQMVYSVINVEEEMNQQALYLLAVGRFYTQGNNNSVMESTSQYSQTSLAMQSILSGTISQQLNSVLSSVMGSGGNWNVGANISTGIEGFNDAEYEGLLSGRMLNNRLLFNGQFGYRDNANATTSFIGDFDLRYLLFPNGNLSINVYNKTNDRYFTRNTLTTQGIGIVMKKDFNGLRDLFGIKRKKKMRTEKKKMRKRE